MGQREVTRRQVLVGLAGATGVGAAVGSGTAAMVTDEAVLEEGAMRSGRIDLAVDWRAGGEAGSGDGAVSVPLTLSESDPTAVVDLTVSLPELDGENNPAFVWARSACPDGHSLLEALSVTLRNADCTDDCALFEGSLAAFARGVPLPASGGASAPDHPDCLRPGESLDLVLDVELGDFEGYGSAEFSLEFTGTQCRNVDGTDNPFPAVECGTTSPTHDISNVAFCTTEDVQLDPSVDALEWGDDGPLRIGWETDHDVDLVCVKASTGMTVYDYRDPYMDSNEAWPGDPDARITWLNVPPSGAASPCALAMEALPGSAEAPIQSTKLDLEETDA